MIYTEIQNTDFEPWGSTAISNWEMLERAEQEKLIDLLDERLQDENGLTGEAQINDCIWFDFGWCCELLDLDYDEENDVIKR